MSPKNSFLKASLSALGVIGFAVSGIADPPASPPVDQASSAAPISESEDTVLLMSDGRVLRGRVTETAKGYLIKQRGNTLPKPRESVQGIFRTLDEAYRFQADHVPARDPDEQMKLARWCMTNNLMAEAKIHLTVVAALSPKSPAKGMLERIELSEANATLQDQNVRKAGAEMPRELNPGPAKPPRRQTVSGPPRIFDLPAPLAVKRAQEFIVHVQPVLQRICAGCHNEAHAGELQLVQFKNKHDMTPDAHRMNLDAILRLVDAENPAKSELLSSCLRPHGDGPRKRPIFLGSNNPDYQVLSTWVNSLKVRRAGDGVAQAGLPVSGGEAFAAARGNRSLLPAADPALKANGLGATAGPNVPPGSMAPSRYVPGQGFVPETLPPTAEEFPVPFAVGGAPPKTTGTQPVPGLSPPAELPDLPSTAIPPPIPAPKSAAATDASKKPRKPVKLDDALLQQVLQNRNTPK